MMRVAPRSLSAVLLALVSHALWPACSSERREGNDRATARAVDEANATPEAEAVAAAPDIAWATRIGQAPTPTEPPSSAAEKAARIRVLPATMIDHAYDSDAVVSVRHLVYRVAFVVPPALRSKRPPMLAPAGELHVDVALERLRARFVGPGWPLDDGSEVRLRADAPGAYLFDGAGGRPLAPGQLASWFQGNENARAKTSVRIRREPGLHDQGPGDLMCALLAEWTAQDREELLPRCQGGAMPPGFRLGLWSAELTAIVPITLPRRKLRADSADPPEPIAPIESRPMLGASEVSHLSPLHMLRVEREQPEAPPVPGSAAMQVDNRLGSRVVIVVQGVPLGFVRGQGRATFEGFTPGYYRVGAVRPFGQPAMTPTLFRAPGALRFGKADPKN